MSLAFNKGSLLCMSIIRAKFDFHSLAIEDNEENAMFYHGLEQGKIMLCIVRSLAWGLHMLVARTES